MNVVAILSALLGIAAFFTAYRYAKALKPPHSKILLLSLGVLGIPGLSYTLYYLHLFGDHAWYFQFRSFWLSELFVIPTAASLGAATAFFPSLLRSLCLLAAIGFSVVPALKPLLWPIDGNAFRDHWEHAVCYQSTPSTCGPASLATILKAAGIEMTESQIAREAYSYRGGTEAWYLARVARSQGCSVQFLNADDLESVPLPAIAGVKIAGRGHFIPILAREGAAYTLGDPMFGLETLTVEELKTRYVFTGFYFVVGKG